MALVLFKSTLLFAVALACMPLMRRASSVTRHLVCACAMAAALLLPLTMLAPPEATPIRLSTITFLGDIVRDRCHACRVARELALEIAAYRLARRRVAPSVPTGSWLLAAGSRSPNRNAWRWLRALRCLRAYGCGTAEASDSDAAVRRNRGPSTGALPP